MQNITIPIVVVAAGLLLIEVASAQNGRRGNDLGQILQNQLENEIRDAVGLPNRSNRRFDDFDRNFSDRNGNGRWNNRGRDFDDRYYDRDFGQRRRFDDDRRGFDRNDFRNPIVGEIIRQFPGASRILTPSPRRNHGAYFRNDRRYYYYPGPAVSPQLVPQTAVSGTIQTNPVVVTNPPMVDGSQQQPIEIKFGEYAYIDELSQTLPVVANDLCLDMHHNYQRNPGFDAAYRDAYGMLEASRQVRASFEADDRDAVMAALKEADEHLHRVEAQTRGWTRQHQRQIGELGMITKIEIAADMIHHMMYDAGIPLEEHGEQTSSPQNDASPQGLPEQAPPPRS